MGGGRQQQVPPPAQSMGGRPAAGGYDPFGDLTAMGRTNTSGKGPQRR